MKGGRRWYGARTSSEMEEMELAASCCKIGGGSSTGANFGLKFDQS